MELDCKELVATRPSDQYAHEYDGYLLLFQTLANASQVISLRHVPRCWVPFVRYLGHEVESCTDYSTLAGWECDAGEWPVLYERMGDKRRAVEITSTCRPELVHALYCADTEWPCFLRHRVPPLKEFLVTCNGSFFRDEVRDYREQLQRFTPTRRQAILVPCAASKPYPAPLHREVLSRIDRGKWHVITATGVLGLIPEELWDVMPWYDSGLPNLPRCTDTVRWYFSKHRYAKVVVYSDFYAHAIRLGLCDVRGAPETRFVLGDHYRDRYENLLLTEHLLALERTVAELEGRGE